LDGARGAQRVATGAASETHQNGLDDVAGVVALDELRRAVLSASVAKKRKAAFAPERLIAAGSVAGSIAGGVFFNEFAGDESDTEGAGDFADEARVLGALGACAVIEVEGEQTLPAFRKMRPREQQRGERVRAGGASDGERRVVRTDGAERGDGVGVEHVHRQFTGEGESAVCPRVAHRCRRTLGLTVVV
jgi:hypothetical protein